MSYDDDEANFDMPDFEESSFYIHNGYSMERNRNRTEINGVKYCDNGKILLSCSNELEGDFVVPDGVDTIGMNAFVGCSKIRSIYLPASVEKVLRGAFWGCGVKKIIMSRGLYCDYNFKMMLSEQQIKVEYY